MSMSTGTARSLDATQSGPPRSLAADALQELLLVDHVDPERLGPRQLRPGSLAGDDEARLLRHARRDPCALGFGRGGRLLARERGQPPREDDAESLEPTGGARAGCRAAGALVLEAHPGRPELPDQLQVLVFVEPLSDRRRDLGTDLR